MQHTLGDRITFSRESWDPQQRGYKHEPHPSAATTGAAVCVVGGSMAPLASGCWLPEALVMATDVSRNFQVFP